MHEVLIMPKSEDMDPKELRNMVQDVNATQVAEGEILSDQVYGYDAKTHKLMHLCSGKGINRSRERTFYKNLPWGLWRERLRMRQKRRNRFMSRSSTVEEAGNKKNGGLHE